MTKFTFEKNKKLSDGHAIPVLGYGTYLMDGNAVREAIKAGYRHLDGAFVYGNEVAVGAAIRAEIDAGTVKRKDLFVTSKVPDFKLGYESTIDCVKNSLKETGLDYFDLYLIHSPNRKLENWQDGVIDTWRALEKLHDEGLIKSIGVSNFGVKHLEFLLSKARIKPVINQIEVHPEHQQRTVVKYCEEHDIAIECWGTLNQGRIFKNETFMKLAEKYHRSASQIAIQWSVKKGYIPLATTSKPERMTQHLNVDDFEISDADMQLLDGLDGGAFSYWHLDCEPEKLIPLSAIDKIIQERAETKSQTWRYYFLGIPFLKIKQKTPTNCKYYLFGLPIMKKKKR